MHAGFIDDSKNFPRSVQAYCADGLAIVVGSMMGTSPCTTYIESATGIQSGGRTGVTALVVCFYYFLCLFFAPILGERNLSYHWTLARFSDSLLALPIELSTVQAWCKVLAGGQLP